ncbi:hypothetical protein B296_00054716 [Ensete ventricosum]|uniref:Uncharacterized protein n=1 Tax=Ensete ventricosum TaxID=4639 RepID=A0A426X2H8_ENSVE|nr:hypothetical protein B296_00054716 [Ensete ventricosum]
MVSYLLSITSARIDVRSHGLSINDLKEEDTAPPSACCFNDCNSSRGQRSRSGIKSLSLPRSLPWEIVSAEMNVKVKKRCSSKHGGGGGKGVTYDDRDPKHRENVACKRQGGKPMPLFSVELWLGSSTETNASPTSWWGMKRRGGGVVCSALLEFLHQVEQQPQTRAGPEEGWGGCSVAPGKPWWFLREDDGPK